MKKVLSVLLVATSLFALVGCGGKTENMQKEIEALKQSLAELQATVSTQSEQIGTLQGEKTAQAEKIAELEAAKAAQAETIAAQTEKLEQLENLLNDREYLASELLPKGAFCSLQTAYDNGWITEEEVAHIAYLYNNCGEEEVGNYVFDSSHLDDFLLYSIKKMYIEYELEDYPESERTMDDLGFGAFFGQYGNCIVLSLRTDPVYGVPMRDVILRDLTVANSTFKKFYENYMYVWYPIEE